MNFMHAAVTLTIGLLPLAVIMAIFEVVVARTGWPSGTPAWRFPWYSLGVYAALETLIWMLAGYGRVLQAGAW